MSFAASTVEMCRARSPLRSQAALAELPGDPVESGRFGGVVRVGVEVEELVGLRRCRRSPAACSCRRRAGRSPTMSK